MMKNLFKKVLCVCLVAVMAATVFATDVAFANECDNGNDAILKEALEDLELCKKLKEQYNPDECEYVDYDLDLDGDGYNGCGEPMGNGLGRNEKGTNFNRSHIYFYRDKKVNQISYTDPVKGMRGSVHFTYKNSKSYKVVLSGLKNSKSIISEYDSDCCNVQEAIFPVKNGKAVFYVKPKMEYGECRINWLYQKNEKNVHVEITPVSKDEVKKNSVIKTSKSNIVLKNGKYVSFTISANEPVKIDLKPSKTITGEKYTKNASKGNITFRSGDWCTDDYKKPVVLIIKGLCSGKVVKVKITRAYKYEYER